MGNIFFMEKTDDSPISSGKNFTELEVWKKVRKLKNNISDIAQSFPWKKNIGWQTR